jgi:thiamine biosynthesis protein ThiS
MEISVNGEKKNFEMPMTISGLLDSLGINPQSVVVERNLQIVPRSELKQQPIEEGDAIEIIRLVGGG